MIRIDKEKELKRFSTREDKIEFGKIVDLVVKSSQNNEVTYSDFYNPIFVEKVLNSLAQLSVETFGGSVETERVVMSFKSKESEKKVKFPIVALEIFTGSKLGKLVEHRDVLGSLIGLGIERCKIGDIKILEGKVIVFVKEEVADFIEMSLEKLGRRKVSVKICTFIEETGNGSIEKSLIVSSLRLDVIVSEVFNLSRSETKKLFEKDKIFVNWVLVDKSSKEVREGETISVRGFGRINIKNIDGKTKKDKIRLRVES